MIRRRASLHEVRSGPVSPLLWYYHGATTSCRPSRRPSLPSRGGTTRCVWGFVPLSARRPTERPGVFGLGVPRDRSCPWRRQDLPSSWGTPLASVSLLYDSGRPARPSPTRDGSAAPATDQDDGAHIATFEALSHCVGSRCICFVPWITPLPRKTRFQVLVRLSWLGVPPTGFR